MLTVTLDANVIMYLTGKSKEGEACRRILKLARQGMVEVGFSYYLDADDTRGHAVQIALMEERLREIRAVYRRPQTMLNSPPPLEEGT